jgi:hypothetical protein
MIYTLFISLITTSLKVLLASNKSYSFYIIKMKPFL